MFSNFNKNGTQIFIDNRYYAYRVALQAICTAENVWAFGTHAGIDFNTGAPVAINTNIVTTEATASVCDENGQLLFYTNGEKIWDYDNNFMQNGYDVCGTGTVQTTAQGAVIIPFPDSPSKYYVFSLTAEAARRLYYCVVDMTLNNGLGAVVEGRKGILVDSNLQEQMTAVAGTNCDIWLLTLSQQSMLKAYNISYNGINSIPVQSPILPGGIYVIPSPNDTVFTLVGAMCVSPDRSKLAIGNGGLGLYDFDAATGMINNARELLPNDPSNGMENYSVCFSPDNSKLYAAQGSYLNQFDVSSGIQSEIIASITTVPGANGGGALKLAPDGKIYCVEGTTSIGIINQPDQPAASCGYVSQSVPLVSNTYGYLGLPNVVATVMLTGDTIYNVENINVGDCFVNTYTLQADTPGHNYLWDNGATVFQRAVYSAGTYHVTYVQHCIVHAVTFNVRFPNAAPDLQIHPACKGQQNGRAVAVVTDTGYTFTWRNNAGTILSTSDSLVNVAGGSYTLQVSTSSGCDTTMNISIPEADYTAAFQADSIVCQGSLSGFINTSDAYFTQFEWDFGDAATSSLPNPVHSYATTGSYTVQLIAWGTPCTDTAYKTIVVDSIFDGRYTLDQDSICTGESITFYPGGDNSISSRQWQFGDGTAMTEPGDTQIQHAYDSAGALPVVLTTQYRACPATAFTDTVFVFALPQVYLGPDTGLCLNGAPIVLSNQFPRSLPVTGYQWSTGDTDATIEARHPGTYTLTVSSAPLGCSASDAVTVTKDCYIDIPNAFTPDGDGDNDYFFPRQLLSKSITRFNMQVMNRWGQVIFETNSIAGRGWDGRFNGTPQPPGVYVYIIDATIAGDRAEHHRGNVTLLR